MGIDREQLEKDLGEYLGTDVSVSVCASENLLKSMRKAIDIPKPPTEEATTPAGAGR